MIRSINDTRCRLARGFVASAAAALLTACGHKSDIGGDSENVEVAAKVNGISVTMPQLEIALQKQRAAHPDAQITDALSKQVLDQLVDEEIIAQKAVAAKLDQDSQVLQQLEAARRDILARRFIETAADSASKPVDDQVQKFYDSHPQMFSQRAVYTLQRMDIQAPDARRAEIDAHVRSLKSADELTGWLKSQNLPFNTRQEQDASEQIVPPILEKLATMKIGESTVIPTQSNVTALTLISSAPAPKTLSEARPAIAQFLSVQGRRQLIVDLQKSVRDGAKVEYEGRFAASAPLSGDVGASAAALTSSPPSAAASRAASPASQDNSVQK